MRWHLYHTFFTRAFAPNLIAINIIFRTAILQHPDKHMCVDGLLTSNYVEGFSLIAVKGSSGWVALRTDFSQVLRRGLLVLLWGRVLGPMVYIYPVSIMIDSTLEN